MRPKTGAKKKKKICLLLDRETGFAESSESLSLPPCSGRQDGHSALTDSLAFVQ